MSPMKISPMKRTSTMIKRIDSGSVQLHVVDEACAWVFITCNFYRVRKQATLGKWVSRNEIQYIWYM
jgi:Zn-finger protein